jgi:hypothetical protein
MRTVIIVKLIEHICLSRRTPSTIRINRQRINELNIQDPRSAQQEERFARDAKLATTSKGEAMISFAVTWTADVLRQMIAEG